MPPSATIGRPDRSRSRKPRATVWTLVRLSFLLLEGEDEYLQWARMSTRRRVIASRPGMQILRSSPASMRRTRQVMKFGLLGGRSETGLAAVPSPSVGGPHGPPTILSRWFEGLGDMSLL